MEPWPAAAAAQAAQAAARRRADGSVSVSVGASSLADADIEHAALAPETHWWPPTWLHALVRGRWLYDQPGAAFDIDFTDSGAAQIIFDEGQGSLLTDGSRACMEKDHILYDQELDESGARGMILKMDNEGVRCGHDSQIAVGHLASWDGYGFGDFEWVGRVAHAPDGGPPPANSFCCFSTYVHGSLPHNEMAWC